MAMNNSLAEVRPELVPEWSEKNLPLKPDEITFGSNKKVWWRGACGHEWQTSVKARSNGEKCPICSGARVIAGINDLATLEPLLVKQWSKKNKIKPTEVSIGSHKKVIEAYEPIIQKYAKEYGIPEYVELIKAVMMQESGGRGLDPMQAAEGSFNTKYPHEPNGIKDPEYSIQCGVQELKAALTSAEVESPIDMEHIKLALQGYNFGNGYISWAKTKYGGYSYANAVEFSTQQAQRLGWDSYGDTQYPAHVLRYYPYGRAFTAGGNQAIVEVALTQLGNQGGQPYWSWYGFNSRVEWCACFVSWCADQCGYIESGLVPKFAGCVDGANWFKSNGKWQDRTYEPKVGDIIFFDWEGDGTTDHVGIVEKCENGTVYTVEGNSGDACKQRQYAVGSSNIYGYGIPAY